MTVITTPTSWVRYHGMGCYNQGPVYGSQKHVLVRAPFGLLGHLRVGLVIPAEVCEFRSATGVPAWIGLDDLEDPGQRVWQILLAQNDPHKIYAHAWWRSEYPRQIAAIKALLAFESKV